MFNFIDMFGNYEQRKVARYDDDNLSVSTAAVNDSEKPFETAVKHKKYNNGHWVIVELYNTKEESQKGHDEWVAKMTADILPSKLIDVSTSAVAKISDLAGKEWRDVKKTNK